MITTAPSYLYRKNCFEFLLIDNILHCCSDGLSVECHNYADIPDQVLELVEPIILKNKKLQKALIRLVGSDDIEAMVFQYIKCRFGGNDIFTDIENKVITYEYVECPNRATCPVERIVCRFHNLTPREIEIVRFIAQGYCDKEIAYMLHISVNTMPVHRRNIHNKLGTLSKPQIAAWAVKHNIF